MFLVEGRMLVVRVLSAFPLLGVLVEATLALFLGVGAISAEDALEGDAVYGGEVHLDEVVVFVVLLDIRIMDILSRRIFSSDLLARDDVIDVYYGLILLQVFSLHKYEIL